jgi:hypothetical protein
LGGRRRVSEEDPPDEYVPPPEEECVLDEHPIDLYADGETGERHVLYRRALWYRGKVVDFCLEQRVRVNQESFPVCRIDTRHGTVHRHDFTQGEDGNARRTLVVIPKEGHDVVNREHDSCLDWMLDNWDANLRRWTTC